jgi:uncharacterized protein YjbI with pentapeptide repeats
LGGFRRNAKRYLTHSDGGFTKMNEIIDKFNETSTLRLITEKDLKNILEEHKIWLESKGKDGKRASLRSTNLYKADLKGCNLAYADLQDAYLCGTQFDNACLVGANMKFAVAFTAYFDGADCKRANFKYSDLTTAGFIKADLTAANLENTNCAGGFFMDAILKDTRLKSADLHYAQFAGADFDGADLQGADLLGLINFEEENLPIDQLCRTKSLYNTQLDEEILEKVKARCPHLLEPISTIV